MYICNSSYCCYCCTCCYCIWFVNKIHKKAVVEIIHTIIITTKKGKQLGLIFFKFSAQKYNEHDWFVKYQSNSSLFLFDQHESEVLSFPANQSRGNETDLTYKLTVFSAFTTPRISARDVFQGKQTHISEQPL